MWARGGRPGRRRQESFRPAGSVQTGHQRSGAAGATPAGAPPARTCVAARRLQPRPGQRGQDVRHAHQAQRVLCKQAKGPRLLRAAAASMARSPNGCQQPPGRCIPAPRQPPSSVPAPPAVPLEPPASQLPPRPCPGLPAPTCQHSGVGGGQERVRLLHRRLRCRNRRLRQPLRAGKQAQGVFGTRPRPCPQPGVAHTWPLTGEGCRRAAPRLLQAAAQPLRAPWRLRRGPRSAARATAPARRPLPL